MMVRSWICAAFAAWLGVTSLSASAEAQSKETRKKAGELFSRGETFFENEQYIKAAEAFSLAYDLAPHPSVLVNIGLSYDRARRYPKAVEAYRKYMDTMDADRVEDWVSDRLKELEGKVGQLHVDCPTDDCVVQIDEVEVGTPPIDILLEPGPHDVEAFVDGGSIAHVEASVEPGGKASVILVRTRSDEQEEPVSGPGQSAEASDSRIRWLGLGLPFWIASGVTVASGAATIGFGLKTSSLHDEWISSEDRPESLKNEGEKFRTLTNVSLGITLGAAAAAAGFAIYDLTVGSDGDSAVVAAPLEDGGLAATWVMRF